MKAVISDEMPRCSIKRNIHLKINETNIEIMEKRWLCSIQISFKNAKSKSNFIPITFGKQTYGESVTLTYVHSYYSDDNLMIKLYKKSKVGEKLIANCSVSLPIITYSGFKGILKVVGIGKHAGREFGTIDVEIETLPLEYDNVGDVTKFENDCLKPVHEKFNAETPPEKKSKTSTLRRVMHLQKKETIKRSSSPKEEEQTEVENVYFDKDLSEIDNGVIILVQARKKKSEQIRKIIECTDNKEMYHFVEVRNGCFNKQIIPFLVEMRKKDMELPIVLCGGDWFVGLFVRAIYSINERKNVINICPYFLPTTKNCLISSTLFKKDSKYASLFETNWLDSGKDNKQLSSNVIEYLDSKCSQKFQLSEVCYSESDSNVSIPMILSSKITSNKTVTVEYLKAKDKKSTMVKTKKIFEEINIQKNIANNCFSLILYRKNKAEDKDDIILCDKIIVSSDDPMKLFVEKDIITSQTTFITFKQDFDGKNLSIHSFN